METTVIDFILSTLAQLSAQYPDAAWIITALSVLMTVCGPMRRSHRMDARTQGNNRGLCRRISVGSCLCSAFWTEQGGRG